MLPLLLFLIGCGVVYVATIESAFGAMVRLPERLNVERDIQHGSLTIYLEDPLRLYVATRLLRGLLFATAAVVLARLIGVSTPLLVAEEVEGRFRLALQLGGPNPQGEVRSDASNVLTIIDEAGAKVDQFIDPREDDSAFSNLGIDNGALVTLSGQYGITRSSVAARQGTPTSRERFSITADQAPRNHAAIRSAFF